MFELATSVENHTHQTFFSCFMVFPLNDIARVTYRVVIIFQNSINECHCQMLKSYLHTSDIVFIFVCATKMLIFFFKLIENIWKSALFFYSFFLDHFNVCSHWNGLIVPILACFFKSMFLCCVPFWITVWKSCEKFWKNFGTF